jgi:hypothetical protein
MSYCLAKECACNQSSINTYHDHECPEGPIDGDEEASDHQAKPEESSYKSHIIYLLTIIINESILPSFNSHWHWLGKNHALLSSVRLRNR